MSKNLLLYKTKWGATKKYAEWIRDEEPSLNLEEIEGFDFSTIDDYYKVVIGSRTYMGKIMALDYIVNNWDHMREKKVYLFSVGLIPPESEESKVSYEMIPPEIRQGLNGYSKLMGKIDLKKLNPVQKTIVKYRKLDSLGEMDRASIEPIVSFLKGCEWKIKDTLSYTG